MVRHLLAALLIVMPAFSQAPDLPFLAAASGPPASGGGATFALVQSKAYASSASATTHNLVFTSQPVQNNLIVITACSDATISTPIGYSVATSDVNDIGIYIFYKVAGAGESATVTLSPSVSDSLVAQGFEFSGMATTTPLDQSMHAVGVALANNCATGTTPATSQANELIVASFGGHFGTVNTAATWTSGLVQQLNSLSTGSTFNEILESSYLKATSTGTFGTTGTFVSGSINSGRPGGCIATFKITNP